MHTTQVKDLCIIPQNSVFWDDDRGISNNKHFIHQFLKFFNEKLNKSTQLFQNHHFTSDHFDDSKFEKMFQQ